jgi:hypothetical protein
MSISSEYLRVSPPRLDYIGIVPAILDTLLLLELHNECKIECISRIRREFIHYLHMFYSERADNDLLMVDDAPGLDVNVLQGPTYHVVIRHEPQPCRYFVQLRLHYIYDFSFISVALFFGRVLRTVYDFML